ncbi:MAG TPA: flagellar hook-basal body complex protein FliE [Solirubrobacter sp.]|nr:flagellar hook-basal body complex protein FliE [Solirubrobacter sp.]
MPIDPSFAVSGAEWQIAPPEAPADAASGAGSDFGKMLSDSISSLAATQNEAATQAQALATGQAEDPTTVVMAVERAQLAMQLASQIRTKAVEAAQDLFHTQV